MKCSSYGFKRGKRGHSKLNSCLSLGIGLKLILVALIFGLSVNNNYSKVCQESNNKLNHILNGNRSKSGYLSLYTWNKGNSTFSNRRNDRRF